MKIGIDARILARPFGGIARYVLEMTRHLAKGDNELFVYLPSPPQVSLHQLEATVRIGSGKGENGLQRHLWAQTSLPFQASRDRLDVFWGPAHRLPAILPRHLARVVTIHDLVWHYFPQTMRRSVQFSDRMLMPSALANADLVVADSIATADSLRAVLGVPKDRLRVVYPGTTNPEDLDLGGTPTAGLPQSFILFVGTLEPRKNLERLLAAYATIDETVRNRCSLLLAGASGWGGRNIADVIAQHDLENHVMTMGFVSEPLLAELYARCRFLAFPSLYEGFGLPIVEANRAGRPVLTSANSSMIEVAGDAGLLVDATDVHAIASGLSRLIMDDALLGELASSARTNAARFDWQASALQLTGIFEDAITSRRSGR